MILNKQKRKAFLSLEIAFSIVAISIILLSSLGFYSYYVKSKINVMKNIQIPSDLYYDLEYHMKKIGYPNVVSAKYVSFDDDQGCTITYAFDQENSDIIKDIDGCDEPELNEQKIMIKDIKDINFTSKANKILLLKINTLSNRNYPIIFRFHTPIYSN